MSTPQEAVGTLQSLAKELNDRSLDLATVERRLEPLETGYRNFLAAYDVMLWKRHVEREEKFPPEKVRERLALKAMDEDDAYQGVQAEYNSLVASRRRIEQRIRDLRHQVDAWRSVISAMKESLV